MMLSPECARSLRSRLRRDPARDEVEIILDRKIPPRFVGLLPNQLLLVHAPVMPEHGCPIVKTEMVPVAGRAQLEGAPVDFDGFAGSLPGPCFDLAWREWGLTRAILWRYSRAPRQPMERSNDDYPPR